MKNNVNFSLFVLLSGALYAFFLLYWLNFWQIIIIFLCGMAFSFALISWTISYILDKTGFGAFVDLNAIKSLLMRSDSKERQDNA